MERIAESKVDNDIIFQIAIESWKDCGAEGIQCRRVWVGSTCYLSQLSYLSRLFFHVEIFRREISLILCPPYILCTVCNSIFCVLFVAFCREICYVAWKILNQKLRLWRKRANMRYATGGTTRGTTGGGRRKPRAVIGPITQLPPPHSNKKPGLKLGQNSTSSQK